MQIIFTFYTQKTLHLRGVSLFETKNNIMSELNYLFTGVKSLYLFRKNDTHLKMLCIVVVEN